MTELEREQRADRAREKRHSTKKFLMGSLMAVLIAGGAYLLVTSTSREPEQLAQSEISTPEFAPSSMPLPSAIPPVPLPDATPVPKAGVTAPAPRAERAPAPTPIPEAIAPLEAAPVLQAPSAEIPTP